MPPPFQQNITVSIHIEDISATRKAINTVVPAAKIADAENALIREFSGEVRLPGFRPGKAPAALVKKQFAKNIAEELKKTVIADTFKSASAESKLNIYTVTNVTGVEAISNGADAALRFEVDIVPDFELPDYKGLDLPVEPVSVGDDEVEKTIESIRAQRGKFEIVDRAAEKGDYVKLSYEGVIDGKPVKELAPDAYLYGSQATTWEEAGADDAHGIAEIVAGIIGKKAGDKAEFTHTFADDFATEILRGKTATYAVEIFEVRARILAELNEEFFKAAGAKDTDELKAKIRENLTAQKENTARAKQRNAAIEALNAKVEIALPESAIEREAYKLFREFANVQLQNGTDVKEIQANSEKLLAESKTAATPRVKVDFILAKIAEKEGIKVERDELNQRIVQEAYIARMPVEKFAKELSKNRELLIEIQKVVLSNKTLDFVLNSAKSPQ